MVICHLCGKLAHCRFAYEQRREGRVPVLVCEECIRRYRVRLLVLGLDFRFVARSDDPGKESDNSTQKTDKKRKEEVLGKEPNQ